MSSATIFTLGPSGTFCHQVALQLKSSLRAASPLGFCRSLEETVRAAAQHPDSYAVAPIENSRTGTVAVVQDEILRSNVRIVSEAFLPVRFSCVSSVPVSEVREIFVHPVAEAQCSDFLGTLSAEACITPARSNTDALQLLVNAEPEARAGAIIPDHAEHPEHFHVIRNVHTGRANVTRFLVLQSAESAPQLDYSLAKTSIVVEPAVNRPGLLRDILTPLERHRINVCRLESRPRAELWSYRFFLDLENSSADTEAALTELRDSGIPFRVLGTYGSFEEASDKNDGE